MSTLFGIRLIPLKIVNGGWDPIARHLAGADGIHAVAAGQQGLKRDHGFIVLGEITRNHENFCHRILHLLADHDANVFAPHGGVNDILHC